MKMERPHLTPDGWQRACEIVRNHRLWELYLTNEASIADRVHDDAEIIEHVLGEETVRQPSALNAKEIRMGDNSRAAGFAIGRPQLWRAGGHYRIW